MWAKILLTRSSTKICSLFSKTKKDPYQILGVSRSASKSQIKKAYYNLAQTHHPDKSSDPGAKDKIAQINGAYQILSDDKKKSIYDQTGSTEDNPYQGFQNQDPFSPFGGRGGMGMGGFQDIFGDIFGFNSRGKTQNSNAPQNVSIRVNLSFNESVNGVAKTLKFSRKCACSTCKGSKSKPGTQPQKCITCNGTGAMAIRQGPMVMKILCQTCQGEGKKITTPCLACNGVGIESIEAIEQITFPKGIDNDSVLRMRGKGHLGGDLEIKVQVQQDKNFKRIGLDAHSSSQISIIDAVLGCEIDVRTIYGEMKKVKVEPGTQSGQEVKLNRDGFYRANTLTKGNHVVTINLKVPIKINEQQKVLYEKLKKVESAKKHLKE